MLTDDVTIHVKAGRGGDGVVRFSKTMMTNAPTGGDGGRGGNVVLEGVSDLGALRIFRTRKAVKAESGKDGAQNTKEGANGVDATILVPVGTMAHDINNDKIYDIDRVGQKVVIAKGGKGGFGNHHFRSSKNTTPMRANEGRRGEEIDVRLELKMIADVGFVGYPNVGKSSLLNELTNASSKVANYKFTTLEPHLGVYYDIVLADIPGLIEGAAEGKGLGHKFLQHIERTRVLFHFVAADSEDPQDDYLTIKKELGDYNPALLEKEEWIIVSKSDEVSQERLDAIVADLAQHNKHIMTLSLLDEHTVDGVKKLLNVLAQKKQYTEQ